MVERALESGLNLGGMDASALLSPLAHTVPPASAASPFSKLQLPTLLPTFPAMSDVEMASSKKKKSKKDTKDAPEQPAAAVAAVESAEAMDTEDAAASSVEPHISPIASPLAVSSQQHEMRKGARAAPCVAHARRWLMPSLSLSAPYSPVPSSFSAVHRTRSLRRSV